MNITVTVNGQETNEEVEPRLLLVHYLRTTLGLRGTHWGCDTSNCGACTVWLDGLPVKSCTTLAAQADGHQVRTVEDLDSGGALDPLQDGFIQEHGLQCGFCTPGMLMTARALLDSNPDPPMRSPSARPFPETSAAAPGTRTLSEPSAGRPSIPTPR